MHNQCLVGVASTKYISGVDGIGQKALSLQTMNLKDALCTFHPTDAHFFTYQLVGANVPQAWPRLNKPIYSQLKTQGIDIVTGLLAFDIDTPNHVPWEQYCDVDTWLNWFHTSFCGIVPWAKQYYCLYTSRAGVRLIYKLDKLITVALAEQKHRWIVNELSKAGLTKASGGCYIDFSCSDWSRCFRLPAVRRENVDTTKTPYFRIYFQENNCFDSDSLPQLLDRPTDTLYGVIRTFDETKPTREQATFIRFKQNNKTGKKEEQDWLKEAEKILKKKRCYSCLFSDDILAEKGKRNTTLLSYVGEAIECLFGKHSISPTHIYALFLPAVDQLEPDGNSDWSDILWTQIGRIWTREEAKQSNSSFKASVEIVEQAATINEMIEGMKKWDDHPDLLDPIKAQSYVSRRLIASCESGTYHLLNRHGEYDRVGVKATTLIARIRCLGLDSVYETKKVTEQGVKDVKAEALINKHAVIVPEVEGRPCISGGYLKRLGASDEYFKLVLPTYNRREDLEPTYSSDVDTWLRHFFGANYLQGIEWIRWSLAFEDGAICALSLRAAPGIGKKLLVQGLSECMVADELADAADMLEEHNYGLMKSPFLHVDEGWPKSQKHHPSEIFRKLVTGQPITVRRKYLPPMKVYNPVRIIFTANDMDIVNNLGAGKDMTPDSLLGLAQRLRHFNLDNAAAVYLAGRGGMRFTSQPGRRWIGGDAGEPSDYVLAKHFLWLYKNRGNKWPGTRLLVDGDTFGDILEDLRLGSGTTPIVTETIMLMLDRGTPDNGIVIDNNRVFVTTSGILSFFRTHLRHLTNANLTEKNVASSLKTISEPTVVNKDKGGIKARWWEINIELLNKLAEGQGRYSAKLAQIMQTINAKKMSHTDKYYNRGDEQ